MQKDKILKILRESEDPMTLEEVSQESDISTGNLRRNLYRLQEEGLVESVAGEEKVRWRLKEEKPVEERYEKTTRKYTS